MSFLEQGVLEIMNSVGSNTIVNMVIFIFAVLAIRFVLKGIFHVFLSAGSGIAFLFLSNRFLGTSFSSDLKTVAFFAAAGALVYLAASLFKFVSGAFKK